MQKMDHSFAPWPTICPGKVSEQDTERQKARMSPGFIKWPTKKGPLWPVPQIVGRLCLDCSLSGQTFMESRQKKNPLDSGFFRLSKKCKSYSKKVKNRIKYRV